MPKAKPKVVKKTAALLRWEAEQAAKKKAAAKPALSALPTKRSGKAPPSPTQRARQLANTGRGKRGPFAAAVPVASTATSASRKTSSGRQETVPARAGKPLPDATPRGQPVGLTPEPVAVVPPVPPHRSYNTTLEAGARHPRPWRVGGGPDGNILSWIVYDARNHPVLSMPFIYSNQASLRAEADLIVSLINRER